MSKASPVNTGINGSHGKGGARGTISAPPAKAWSQPGTEKEIPYNLLIPFIVGLVGIIVDIIAIAWTEWMLVDRGTIHVLSYTRGLFKLCSDDGGSCTKIKNPSSQDQAAQAFAIISVLVAIAGGMAGGVYAALFYLQRIQSNILENYQSKKESIGKASSLLFAWANVFTTVLLFIYIYVLVVYKSDDDLGQGISYGGSTSVSDTKVPGFSFYFAITAAILLGVAGGRARRVLKMADRVDNLEDSGTSGDAPGGLNVAIQM